MPELKEELDFSQLNQIIAPEIKNDVFYQLIRNLAATETLEHVLEIGSSDGGGSTEAFVTGLAQNPGRPKLYCIEISKPRFEKLRAAYAQYPFVNCYNQSSIALHEFPDPEDVVSFYRTEKSGLLNFPLDQVLGWLRQDIQYVCDADVEANAIETIKADFGIETFDMVLIDGSEFTGAVEYKKIKGARLILLDDTNTFKCWHVRRALLDDPMYDVIADDQTLRNGFAAFRRRKAARRIGAALPIHFFTIVLNGEPFIRHHEKVFARLTVPWHWHIVEGVAELKHDTAWSTATGGRVVDSFHDQGRSNDGTTAYLDDLQERYSENLTIYRKPLGEFWDGKREMVNAPLQNIIETCLLWQIDNDELWTTDQLETVHRLFAENPERTAAYYWCWYYVGPNKIISTRYNYAQNPEQEWLRTWRFRPGAYWAAHEPPTLVFKEGDGISANVVDIAKLNPFSQDEMEKSGALFHHFAYATEEQLAFKEVYYGYGDARSRWRTLQAHKSSGKLKDYFGWVSDDTMFDDIHHFIVDPLAKRDPETRAWRFDGVGVLPLEARSAAVARPRILVDGIFWQYLSSGIGRVWENLLREWVVSGFIEHVVVLDRAGTAPRIQGVHYWTIARHDYTETARDSFYLEQVCRQLDADLFVSTYYSTPVNTPSFFCGYDMIPEVMGTRLSSETWNEKRRAILHASGHVMISRNSMDDLERLYPDISRGSTYVARAGVAPEFFRPSEEAIGSFLAAHHLQGRDYVIMVGERCGYHGYKNGALAFRALAVLKDKQLVLVCVGGHTSTEDALRKLAPGLEVRHLSLDDTELRAAYAGAHALLYPSKYEGFGMPPLESMACGTPAIVCRNSSLPEVVDNAALFVDADNPVEMADAINRLYDPGLRADLVTRGYAQAKKFTFKAMGEELAVAFEEISKRLKDGLVAQPSAAWSEFRAFQQSVQSQVVENIAVGTSVENIAVGTSIELEQALQTIAGMRRSPFWRARERIVSLLKMLGLRRRG